jgi:hypothetical protein
MGLLGRALACLGIGVELGGSDAVDASLGHVVPGRGRRTGDAAAGDVYEGVLCGADAGEGVVIEDVGVGAADEGGA